MQKPIYLRQETWAFILKTTESMSDLELLEIAKKIAYRGKTREKILEEIKEKPSAFLFQAGILQIPSLLKDTVIELVNGVEYYIDGTAAEELKEGNYLINLTRLWDHKKFAIKKDEVIKAMMKNLSFDQLEC